MTTMHRTGFSQTTPLILYVARRDLARRYAGSFLGASWALAFPILQIGVYWAVASYGLRLGGRPEFPLGAMLIAGMTPWFLLSDALGAMTRSFTGNAALLKKLIVPAAIMPLAGLTAAMIVHGLVLALAILILWVLGYPPTARLPVLIYFAGCAAAFALAGGTLLALGNAAFRDVGQAVPPMLLLWFWATPIVWPADGLPEWLRHAVTWNPLAYLVDGYRYALVGRSSDFPPLEATIGFWAVTIPLCVLAWVAFRRFKRELADFL